LTCSRQRQAGIYAIDYEVEIRDDAFLDCQFLGGAELGFYAFYISLIGYRRHRGDACQNGDHDQKFNGGKDPTDRSLIVVAHYWQTCELGVHNMRVYYSRITVLSSIART
jgi:hypothetical protein